MILGPLLRLETQLHHPELRQQEWLVLGQVICNQTKAKKIASFREASVLYILGMFGITIETLFGVGRSLE